MEDVGAHAQRGIHFLSGKEMEEKWMTRVENEDLCFIPAELKFQIQMLV